MHQFYRRGHTPKAKPSKSCSACSLKGPLPAPTDPARIRVQLSEEGHGGTDMKHLLNTLFVTSEDIYLSLDGENVVANREHQEIARYPLHIGRDYIVLLPGSIPRSHGCLCSGTSRWHFVPPGDAWPALPGASSGNVLLRRTQYRIADDPDPCCRIARSMIFGKIYNARWSIERTRRDHGLRLDSGHLSSVSSQLKELLPQITEAFSLDALRGLEGGGHALLQRV